VFGGDHPLSSPKFLSEPLPTLNNRDFFAHRSFSATAAGPLALSLRLDGEGPIARSNGRRGLHFLRGPIGAVCARAPPLPFPISAVSHTVTQTEIATNPRGGGLQIFRRTARPNCMIRLLVFLLHGQVTRIARRLPPFLLSPPSGDDAL
jgi:hypothetical protein